MCQVGQLRVELVKLYVNYAKRAKQSLLESHPANIFPMKIIVKVTKGVDPSKRLKSLGKVVDPT